jgi:hypothetical protein
MASFAAAIIIIIIIIIIISDSISKGKSVIYRKIT